MQKLYVLMLCFCTGVCTYLKIEKLKNDYSKDQEYLNKPCIIQGTIQNIQHNEQDKNITTIILKTEKIYTRYIGQIKNQKNIVIYCPKKRTNDLLIGQKIIFNKVQLTQPLLDTPYGQYCIKENIWANAYISSERFYTQKRHQLLWYQHYFNVLSTTLTKNIAQLYNPLFLGKKEKNLQSIYIQHQSSYCGIAHHMARSGIHMVTILGLFITMFHYIRIRYRFRFGIYMLITLGYWAISLSSVSFMRSLCMIIFQMLSKINGFQHSTIHTLTLTTFLTILYNPFYILFLDFQLSFGITTIIAWFFYTKWIKTIAFEQQSSVLF